MLASGRFLRFVKGYNAFKTDNDFKEKAAEMLYSLADHFSAKYESLGDDFIVDCQDDAMKLTMKRMQLLASRQTPSHQIWVAAPVSGSLKFDFDSDSNTWFEHRDETELQQCLEKEVEAVLKIDK